MNKKLLLTLIGTATFVLAGCNATQTIIEPTNRDYQYKAETIDLNRPALNLYVGDSCTLKTRITPIFASDAKVEFTSSDNEIASVDENGAVTAKKPGLAYITATAVDSESVYKSVPVYVTNKIDYSSPSATGEIQALETRLANMANEQTQKYGTADDVDKVKLIRHSDMNKIVDGVKVSETSDTETYIISRSDAYFYVGGYEYDTKASDGNKELVEYGWILRTDESYSSTIYHISGSTKTKLVLRTQSYSGQDRFVVILDMLNALFVSGSDIATNVFKYSLNSEDLTSEYKSFKRLVTDAGYVDEANYVSYALAQTGELTIKPEDESDYEIKANTKVIQDYKGKYAWKDGHTISEEISFSLSYDELDSGEKIVENTLRTELYYINDEVNFELPNEREFTPVADIFEL